MTQTLEAQIKASKLKHAISVLRRLDDEAIFEIKDDGMTCKLVNPANSLMVQITLPRAAFDFYNPDDMRIGIDLDILAEKVLKRVTVKDMISIGGDDEVWQFAHGIHQKSMSLLDPERLRKRTEPHTPNHTALFRMPGKTFKDIVAEAADYGDQVLIHATYEGMTVSAETDFKKTDTYTATLSTDLYGEHFESDASCLYSTDILQDIAVDMKASDNVLFKLLTDRPCEIEYAHDGVAVQFMLAPRIESD